MVGQLLSKTAHVGINLITEEVLFSHVANHLLC